ncbi:MAG: hypothetical protein U0166_05385 [Acidobacteriota bacterium]
MDEARRRARNDERLAELHPAFRRRVAAIVSELERSGFRPRIQDAFRSDDAQAALHAKGATKVRRGFHNLSGPRGPEALAADVIDDDHPSSPSKGYLLALARAADASRCRTGIRWGLPAPMVRALDAAIASRDAATPVKIGWDPCHVEPADVTLGAALRGERPR